MNRDNQLQQLTEVLDEAGTELFIIALIADNIPANSAEYAAKHAEDIMEGVYRCPIDDTRTAAIRRFHAYISAYQESEYLFLYAQNRADFLLLYELAGGDAAFAAYASDPYKRIGGDGEPILHYYLYECHIRLEILALLLHHLWRASRVKRSTKHLLRLYICNITTAGGERPLDLLMQRIDLRHNIVVTAINTLIRYGAKYSQSQRTLRYARLRRRNGRVQIARLGMSFRGFAKLIKENNIGDYTDYKRAIVQPVARSLWEIDAPASLTLRLLVGSSQHPFKYYSEILPIVRGMLMSVYEVMLGEAATFVQRKWTAAKQGAIAAMLPTGERDGIECETCCICQELVDPTAANPIALLKCGHYFHRECILGWDRSICAICRAAHSLRDIRIV